MRSASERRVIFANNVGKSCETADGASVSIEGARKVLLSRGYNSLQKLLMPNPISELKPLELVNYSERDKELKETSHVKYTCCTVVELLLLQQSILLD